MLETLANKISQYLGKNLNKNNEEIAVMKYGLIALLQTVSIFLIAMIFAIIFNFIPEALISFFSVGFLRRLIGGHHSKKLYSCLTVSVLCIVVFSALTRYVIVPHVSLPVIAGFGAIIYTYAFILTYKLAPVDHPNKRIKSEEKRKKLRIKSFTVLILFFIISTLLIILQNIYSGIFSRIAVSLAISVFWQVSMLTKAGQKLISNIDKLF